MTRDEARANLIDITVHIHMETERAVLVSDDGDKTKAVWLPRSQIEINSQGLVSKILEITLPEWLALEKGLI